MRTYGHVARRCDAYTETSINLNWTPLDLSHANIREAPWNLRAKNYKLLAYYIKKYPPSQASKC